MCRPRVSRTDSQCGISLTDKSGDQRYLKEELIMFSSRQARNITCTVQGSRSPIVFVRIEKPVWRFEVLGKIKPVIGWTRLVVDLSCVKRMTTAALAQLLVVKHELSRTGQKMCILGIQDQPRTLCGMLKLTNILFDEPGCCLEQAASSRAIRKLLPVGGNGLGVSEQREQTEGRPGVEHCQIPSCTTTSLAELKNKAK